jgi:hypothetical protein
MLDSPVSDGPSPGYTSYQCGQGRSEFGLASLNRQKSSHLHFMQLDNVNVAIEGDLPRKIQRKLEQSFEGTLFLPTPLDLLMIEYFAAHATCMLGFDHHPGLIDRYDPIVNLFLPFAMADQWCFETMILLFSAYHRHSQGRQDVLDVENMEVASRQNLILSTTRDKITLLADHGISTDEDVVAFLFLALVEYREGDRAVGLLHFQAWREYCEMRRNLGVKPCGLQCKIVVWWCISVMTDGDVELDSIINSTTRSSIARNPEKLFRYFGAVGDGYCSGQSPRRGSIQRTLSC